MNSTSADVLLGSGEIPRVQGLDGSGNSILGTVLGEYDQTPLPGKPKEIDLVLKAGQSIGFSATTNLLSKDTISKVLYWYTDSAAGGIPNLVYNDGRIAFACPVGRDRQGSGQSTPNTFR